jgi:hypothetical protein
MVEKRRLEKNANVMILSPQPPIDYEKAARVRELIGQNILDIEQFKSLVDELDDEIFSDGEIEMYCKQMDKPFDEFRRERYEILEYDVGCYSMITVFWIYSRDIRLTSPTAQLWKKLVGEYLDNE